MAAPGVIWLWNLNHSLDLLRDEEGEYIGGYVREFSTNCITIDTFGGAHKPARADQTVCAQLAAPLRYR